MCTTRRRRRAEPAHARARARSTRDTAAPAAAADDARLTRALASCRCSCDDEDHRVATEQALARPYEADNLIDASCQELEEQTARNEKRERLKSIRQSCAITPSDAAGLAVELGAAPPDLVRTLSDPAMPSPAKKKPL